jgi:hypothetical protein
MNEVRKWRRYSESKKIPFFNSCFDKSQVKSLVSWFLQTYGEKQTIDFLESLKYLGFHQATLAGISIGIEDLEIPPDKPALISEAHIATHQIDQQNAAGLLTSVEKSQCLIDTWNQTSDFLRLSAIHNFRSSNSVNPIYMMAFSGARGNVSQVRQLVAMRGLMADPQGAILEFPIQSNFREGLTITEYLISCYGARKGLVDTALRTATSGYLTRRLVDSAQHAVVSMIDCGTQRGVVLLQKQGNSLGKRILGRILAESLTSIHHTPFPRNFVVSDDAAKIIGLFHSQVVVRSPLTCTAATSICQLCYGWNLASGKLVHIGEAVGVIAAQSIGEPGTQLTMRTFHTGGVGVLSDQALKHFNAPYQGRIIFAEPLPGRFIRTPHGKIAYMVKYSNQKPNRILFKIIETTKQVICETTSLRDTSHNLIRKEDTQWRIPRQREFVVRELEFPSGSLLFVKHGELVAPHQLVAQALRVQLTKQILPESSHAVYSPLNGQVFFESMSISARKKVISHSLPPKNDKFKKKKTESILPSKQHEQNLSIELPEVRTMSKIGSFWVFSGHNQHEIHKSRCFLEPGDLISPQSILFDYHFFSSRQVQLNKIDTKIEFGIPFFQIPIHNVYFVKYAYRFNLLPFQKHPIESRKRKESLEKIVYQTQTNGQRDSLFIWYPSTNLNWQTNARKNIFENYPDIKEEKTQSRVNSGKKVSESCLLKPKSHLSSLSYTHFSPLYFHLPIIDSEVYDQLSEFGPTPPSSLRDIRDASRNQVQSRVHKGNVFVLSFVESKDRQLTGKLRFQSGICNQFSFLNFRRFHRIKDTQTASTFIHTALSFSPFLVFREKWKNENSFSNKSSWVFIPAPKTFLEFQLLGKISDLSSNIERQFVPAGICIEDVCFPKQPIVFEVIPQEIIRLQKVKKLNLKKSIWYTKDTMLTKTAMYSLSKTKIRVPIGCLRKSHVFLHTQRRDSIPKFFELFWYTLDNSQRDQMFEQSKKQENLVTPPSSLRDASRNQTQWRGIRRRIRHYVSISQALKFNLARECLLLEPNTLQKKWANYFAKINFIDTTNPLTVKQTRTTFQPQFKAKIRFQLDMPTQSGWASLENLMRIRCIVLKKSSFSKLYGNFQSISLQGKAVTRGLNVSLYQFGALKNVGKLRLQTYSDNWIMSSHPFSIGCVRAQTWGEFCCKLKKTTGTFTNTLRHEDVFSLKQEASAFKDDIQRPVLKTSVGKVIRWGDEIYPGFGSAHNGQILKQTSNSLTVRVGLPILSSARGIVHVFNKELIAKNQILVTLKSRRLQTEDIVQGIPKIEQLFEARESQGGQVLHDTVHSRLRNAFVRELEGLVNEYKSSNQRAIAVEKSFLEAQYFLVQNIVDAYANQGVKISEKHVEVIVRQMTNRVRILEAGETGLLPGELVQHDWVHQFNKYIRDIGLSEATYEPIVLGISKSVLQSESFLLAASFQEVSRVLVRSALRKKRDFLRGLHENVIVGQLIPAGTGLVPLSLDRLSLKKK